MKLSTWVKKRKFLLLFSFALLSSASIRIGETVGSAMALQAAPTTETSTAALECPEPPIRLIEAIRDRDEFVTMREAEMRDRNAELRATEVRIRQQLEKLTEAEAQLRNTLEIADGAAEADLEKLTAVYEAMKPSNAAELFSAMSPEFAAGFLVRMRPAAAAAVMSGLDPKEAYTITTLIAGRNAKAPRN